MNGVRGGVVLLVLQAPLGRGAAAEWHVGERDERTCWRVVSVSW